MESDNNLTKQSNFSDRTPTRGTLVWAIFYNPAPVVVRASYLYAVELKNRFYYYLRSDYGDHLYPPEDIFDDASQAIIKAESL